jgi:AraC-like DNA-binding protein
MNAKLKTFFARYNYLLRLMLTICTALLLSVFTITYVLVQRSYNEINNQNTDYYIEHTYHFSNYYSEQINRMLDVALHVGLDGKLKNERIKNRVWDRIEAVRIMSEYGVAVPMADHIAICFYDFDHVFTSNYSYSVRNYIEMISDGDEDMAEGLTDLLTADNGKRFTVLSSYQSGSVTVPRIILAVPISTELKYENNAVVIYSLSEDSFSLYFLDLLGIEQHGLAIFDPQCLPFYYNSEFDTKLCRDEEFLSFLTGTGSKYYEYQSENGLSRVFRWQDPKTGLFFVSVIPENIVMQRINEFYSSLRLMFVFMFVGMLSLVGATVYFNYKPVLSMVRRIRILSSEYIPDIADNELKSAEKAFVHICNEYDSILDTVSEQRMMIMEYMLGNILYGLPFNKEKITILDKSLLEKSFMVISVQGLKLDNKNRESLTRTICEQSGIGVYITDIQYEPIMVIICVIDAADNSRDVAACVENTMKSLFDADYIVGVGDTVNNLNDIRNSYLKSLAKLDANFQAVDATWKSKNKHLKKLMLEYVNENFNSPDINLAQVADRFSISVYTCSRLFKEFTGIGFKEYISAKRMELAKDLLLSTNKNINKIAREVGFEHPSYFMTWFKANSGFSPSRFRKTRYGW